MDSQIYAKKAKENLAAAEACSNAGYCNASVSRAYYAMFQAAVAVLIHKGITPPSGTFGISGFKLWCLKILPRGKK